MERSSYIPREPKVKVTYADYDKGNVANIVGDKNFEKVVVTSTDDYGRLVQVNYEGKEINLDNDDYNPMAIKPESMEVSSLRGAIFDTEAKVQVAGGSTYTYKITTNGDDLYLNDEGELVVTDEEGNLHTFPYAPSPKAKTDEEDVSFASGLNIANQEEVNMGASSFSRYYSYGSVLMFYKWKGKVYVSNHKKINGKETSYNSTISFYQRYQIIGGPTLDALFPVEGCEYSPYCYRFLVTNPKTEPAATMLPMSKHGYITFIGVLKMWSFDTETEKRCPYKFNEDPEDRRIYGGVPDLRTSEEVLDIENMCNIPVYHDSFPERPRDLDGYIYYPKTTYTLNKINEMLRYGFIKTSPGVSENDFKLSVDKVLDQNFGTGEPVIITYYQPDKDGKLHSVSTLLTSPSYKRKLNLRSKNEKNQPPIFNSFLDFVNYSKTNIFKDKVPDVEFMSFQQLKKAVEDSGEYDELILEDVPRIDETSKAVTYDPYRKEDQAAYYFLLTVNPKPRLDLAKEWIKFRNERLALCTWLASETRDEAKLRAREEPIDRLLGSVLRNCIKMAERLAESKGKDNYSTDDLKNAAKTITLKQHPRLETLPLIRAMTYGFDDMNFSHRPIKTLPKWFKGYDSWNDSKPTKMKREERKYKPSSYGGERPVTGGRKKKPFTKK